jgi:predicted metal-dependent HD superfamily phosphohydrolase
MIRDQFFKSALSYHSTEANASILWNEIEKQYSQRGRHYHTIVHLENLTNELLPVQNHFKEWNITVFAIVYHDIVYKASKNNNEEKSAELAVKRLTSLSVPKESIDRCEKFILATKRHEPIDKETDLFTDADLSILGSNPDSYKLYTQQVRKEYSIYPDLLYKPGRKKVLLHFLEMKEIYKSEYFRDRYEIGARRNLKWELDS